MAKWQNGRMTDYLDI